MAELDRRRMVAASLRSILSALNSDLPIEKLLDFIVNQALPLLSADTVAIYHQDSEKRLSIQSIAGQPLELIQSANAALEKIAIGEALFKKQPVFCTNLADIVIKPDLNPDQFQGFDEIIRRYRSILVVPIDIRNESYGVLTLFFVKRHKLNDDELDLAIDYSIQVALAIDNARLRINAKVDAVNQERNRLARELHDSVIQDLFSASLIADTLPVIMQRDPEKGLEGVNELQLLTRGALAEMRSLLLELRPRAIEEARLEELIKQMAESASGRLRKPVFFSCNGQIVMPVEARLTFYRIAQEAINNIVKHAEANHISITLESQGITQGGNCEKASLTITDDGRGVTEKKDPSCHLGFKIMRERADSIGAKLSITSQIERGTTVQLNWDSKELETP